MRIFWYESPDKTLLEDASPNIILFGDSSEKTSPLGVTFSGLKMDSLRLNGLSQPKNVCTCDSQGAGSVLEKEFCHLAGHPQPGGPFGAPWLAHSKKCLAVS